MPGDQNKLRKAPPSHLDYMYEQAEWTLANPQAGEIEFGLVFDKSERNYPKTIALFVAGGLATAIGFIKVGMYATEAIHALRNFTPKF